MRITLLGNYGVTNIGDEAIREGLTYALKQAFGECEITVMGKGNFLPLGFRSFIRSLVSRNAWAKPLRSIRQADLFVIGGGGLFTDEEGAFVSTFWILHGFAALLCNKPIAILGVSIGKLHFFNRFLLKILFSKAKFVSVRDVPSQKFLKHLNISSHLGPDFAVLIPYAKHEQSETPKPYIVLSFRPYKKSNQLLYKKIAQLCDFAIQKYGLEIRFLPFQDKLQNDISVLNKILNHSSLKQSIKMLPFDSNIAFILDIISGAELTLGMRLHAGIFSVITATPFLPFVYMNKIADFWQEFCPDLRVNYNNATLDELISQFDQFWNNRRENRILIQNICQKLMSRSKVIIQLIRELKF